MHRTSWKNIIGFTLKIFIYAVIIFFLIYLYQYLGISSAHFIYNEF
ncbi:teichoic acid D-Ala incorporation-associated protein DltX [Lactobacillus helsingborgensis]|uniref:Teichoic acid D-Ala incorporation-associated protein DltX n=1 Tax=Lactobacillus helsingborgensis TaxID=1218494 RepID=A0AA47B5I0_9LACO|nr:teichoic acid D-Ala incorporation-associated protein DltX [Lactobacillus helsingborgensis]UZX30523.1 teichoic acid D-Ala incorporation-associated protein DltX [Lactobacillus helsingborgensis]